MIITTSQFVDGKKITNYLGIASGASIFVTPGGNKMINSGWQNGIRDAVKALEANAATMGADAVIAVSFLDHGNSLCATGTAVKLGQGE